MKKQTGVQGTGSNRAPRQRTLQPHEFGECGFHAGVAGADCHDRWQLDPSTDTAVLSGDAAKVTRSSRAC